MDNLHSLIQLVLLNSNIKFSRKSISNSLLYNEQSYSFSYIKDSLNYFSIKSKSYKIPFDILLQFNEFPIVAQINNGREEFVVIVNLSEQYINYYDSKKKKIEQNIVDFNKIYTGYVLIPLPDKYSVDPDYEKNLKEEKEKNFSDFLMIICLFILILILSVQLFVFHRLTYIIWLFSLLLKTTALYIVIQIIKIEIGESNSFIRRVCKDFHCSQVLTSKGSKIFSWLSMGDIGSIYFGFGVFILAIVPFLNSPFPILTFLFLANICTLPYTLFSIGYQLFIIKVWCPLCLSVISILWIEFFIGLIFMQMNLSLSITIMTVNIIIFSGVAALIAWIFLKEYLNKSYQNNNSQAYVKTIKYNPHLFNALLLNSSRLRDITLESEFIWGNPLAENSIILVLSPHCSSCIMMYRSLKEFLSNPLSENLKLILRFVTKGEDEQNWDNQVVDIVLTLMMNIKQEEALSVLEAWFNMKQREIGEWKRKMNLEYFLIDEMAKQRRKLYNSWFFSFKDATTPAIVFNHKIVPIFYTFDDMKYLLNQLIYGKEEEHKR
jgi:hypothetical protein